MEALAVLDWQCGSISSAGALAVGGISSVEALAILDWQCGDINSVGG